MARKLFQTEHCSGGLCDPACHYDCFFPPSPLSAALKSSHGNHIHPHLLILASLLTALLALIGFYLIKMKWRATPSENSEQEFLNHDDQVDHPVWFITTIGLQQSIINSITVCKYKKDEGLIERTDCSVCLNEFQEDETLRLLPKCNHAFHIPCIDTWLRSHTNCPLCRAGIISNNDSSESEEAMSNLGSTEQNNANLGRNQETQIENTRNDGDLSNMIVVATGGSENRFGTGEACEALRVHG